MITMRFSGRTPTPGVIEAGMETDQQAQQLRFILPQVSDTQYAQLCMILPDDAPEVLAITDGYVTLPADITEVPGRIRAWVEILGTDTVAWNSELFYMDVGDLPPISESIERHFPTLLMEAIMAGVRAEAAANAAHAALSMVMAYCRIVNVRVEGETLILDSALLTDENAYALAVLNGYTGTEEEWNAYIARLESGNWNTELQAQMTALNTLAQTALTTAQSKTQAKHAQITISTSDWTGESAPYTAVKACSIVKATDKVITGVGEGAAAAVQKEIARTKVSCVTQGEGTLTFRAIGGLPAENIPVNILALEG